MTGHIYLDVIVEQHARLFRVAMSAKFLIMDENALPYRANIVDECLQSEGITRMDWLAYSLDLNPIEHVMHSIGGCHPYGLASTLLTLELNSVQYVWDMLGRRVAARKPPPTCPPELRRALLDE
ncbi:transposable element Tcb1 transposase [Trichonephila clavipes]|nr:transposable element Tcb1 transposase [Trichonephila clavipes]